ncbi:DoxX family protein [Streptomyces sp. RLB3-17]|uniref:DoxX family protein n=1 Tax=Streptomyces TaxID=1883 RepID=UPI0011624CEA|nr:MULTISPECIES: DoxX family protein [unclassified Streptomyces]QDN77376.1 DoxX family protein [Streptomyces sp. S1A1-7]QDO39462.1 DoxX family protein [Streptomyces sp. RLB3-17]
MSETTVPVTTLTSTSSPTSASSLKTRGRGARISLGALQIVLGLFYALASALPKLIAHPSAAEAFDKLGWGSTGMYLIGALELAGGLALLVPLLSSVAAVALSALMVGAFVVNVTVIHGPYVATPLILILPLALIAWARRNHTTELVRWVRRRA